MVVEASVIFIGKKLGRINHVDINKEDIEITDGIEENLKEYRNILILGLDAKDNTFPNSRSDCIIIASINETTKDVKLVSVYRDTYLELTGRGLDKVNHAYAYGAAPLSLSTLNTNLDLDITEFVIINFDSTEKMINAIGGIPMYVTEKEATQISGIDSEGTYILNGKQALAFGRIRKIDNDYARTERMRKVLMAAFEKAKSMKISEISKLLDELLPEVYTNIEKKEILKIASKMRQYKVVNNFGWPYNVKGITLEAWYGVPVTLETNVQKLHKELFGEEDYEVSGKVKQISNNIINKTGYRK